MARREAVEATDAWTTRRLQVVLGAAAAALILVVAGLAYGVREVLASEDADSTADRTSATVAANPRDRIAAEPMLATTEKDLEPAAPAAEPPDVIRVPAATRTGPLEVSTGFPRTPEGAVAQLASIDTATLPAMSTRHAQAVHAAWSMPGAELAEWAVMEAVRSFHTSAGTVDGDSTISVSTTPVGAQVKGIDGPDWVLACVQLDVTAAVTQSVRFGYGHCERMQWDGARWLIAGGEPPAIAPSTWPGSQRSVEAGWLTWSQGDD